MKDTDLWYILEFFKEMIDKFGDDFKSRYDKFNTETCNDNLPTYKTYKNLIERRYRTICRNLGIIQMLLIDECEENMIVEKYDYYSVSVKGLYVDNRKYYI